MSSRALKKSGSPIKPFKIKIKKGDMVMVRAGKYKKQSGKVLAVHPTVNKITVEKIHVVKKHVKPNRSYPQGGIIEITKPIDVSKVGVINPSTKRPSRIGFKMDKGGKKIRVYRPSGKEIK